MSMLHLVALHQHGSNNPLGIDVKSKADTIPFHPFYTVKDALGVGVFLLVFAFFVFFAPNVLGHPDNYIPANPMVTPAHIVPEWYFLPFYAILRAVVFDIPLYLAGLGLMGLGIATMAAGSLGIEAARHPAQKTHPGPGHWRPAAYPGQLYVPPGNRF